MSPSKVIIRQRAVTARDLGHGRRRRRRDAARSFLSYFAKLTKLASIARYPNLPGVIPYFNSAFDAIEGFDTSCVQDQEAQEVFKKAKEAARDKLSTYYAGSHGRIITTATILDPRLKTDYFRDTSWTDGEIEQVRGRLQRVRQGERCQ